MFGVFTLLVAALFAGAAVYVSIAEHPARLTLDDKAALAQWKVSYPRAALMQATLALIGFVLGVLELLVSEAGPASRADLVRWGRLHAGRSLLAVIATALFVWALI